MTYAEFTAAYTRGEIKVAVDPQGAARFVSGRLLLPFVQMPVLGLGVAAALVGWVYTGLAIIALGVVAPRLIKRSAPRFVLTQALQDPAVYDEVTRTGMLRITAVGER